MKLEGLNIHALPTPLVEHSLFVQEIRELREAKYAYEQIDSDLARSKAEQIQNRIDALLFQK